MDALLDIEADAAGLAITGWSVACVGPDGLAHRRAAGTRNAATGAPVTETTIFEAASLGKPVFAYLALQLVDAGRFGLDEPICAWAPHVFHASDEWKREITARHVLTHTTGLPNWRSAELPYRCFFRPGARFSYSGEGYVLLQKAIEHRLGESLEALARRLVFDPLGMNRSTFDGHALDPEDLAVPHDELGHAHEKAVWRANAAASLHTTAGEYCGFLQAVLSGGGLPDQLWRAWLTPGPAVPAHFFDALDPRGQPPPDPRVTWGLGWGLERQGDFFHWGSNAGFKSFALGSVGERRAFVVLSTGQRELSFGPQLAARLLPGPRPSLDWFDRPK